MTVEIAEDVLLRGAIKPIEEASPGLQLHALHIVAGDISVYSSITGMNSLSVRTSKSITFFPSSQVEVLDSAVIVSSATIDIRGSFKQPFPNADACNVLAVSIQNFSCQSISQDAQWLGGALSSGLIAISGNKVSINGIINATGIVLCGIEVDISSQGVVDSSGYGCPMNNGSGCGCPSGGGGGLGGSGSMAMSIDVNGQNTYVNCDSPVCMGTAHALQDPMYRGEMSNYHLLSVTVGSGGGCVQDSLSAGRGGGVVVIEANETVSVNGMVLANGQDAFRDPLPSDVYGSGSGGTIVIRTKILSGTGSIHADAGENKFYSRTFEGGYGGGGRVIFAADPFYDHAFLGTFSIGSNNQSKSGILFPPACPRGMSAELSNGFLGVCEVCPYGYYKATDDNTQCLPCTNTRPHSYFSEQGQTQPECAFECEAGYKRVGNSCLDSFGQFLESINGFPILGAIGSSVIIILFAPCIILKNVLVYRSHNVELKQEQNKLKLKKKRTSSGFGDFLSNVRSVDVVDLVAETEMNPVLKQIEAPNANNARSIFSVDRTHDSMSILQPRLGRFDSSNLNTLSPLFSVSKPSHLVEIDKSEKSDFKEMLNQHRMTDRDIGVHAERVYILGTNSPQRFGSDGSWRWPSRCPENLKHMIDPVAYTKLAVAITSGVAWKRFSLEHIIIRIIHLLLPPHGQHLVVRKCAIRVVFLFVFETLRIFT
jgi:hypothetical protein